MSTVSFDSLFWGRGILLIIFVCNNPKAFVQPDREALPGLHRRRRSLQERIELLQLPQRPTRVAPRRALL